MSENCSKRAHDYPKNNYNYQPVLLLPNQKDSTNGTFIALINE